MTRSEHRRPRHGSGRVTAAAVAGAVLCGAWLINDGSTAVHPPQPPEPPAVQASASPTAAAGDRALLSPPSPRSEPAAPGVPALSPSQPVRIRIPALKVDAPVTGLGLDSRGQLTSPPVGSRNLVGWYREGVTPGAAGTAVTVGHVDTRKGPAVFYRLGLLRKGDTVRVTRADHRTAVFTVDSVRSFPKDGFPSQEVYAPTGRAELRVITCGGRYDPHTGYQSNTVVFAHLTAVV